MQETHTNFPNKFEAFYLVAVLIAIEFVLAIAFRQFGLFGDIDWQGRGALITVLGNGLVFIFLTTYKQLRYRDLFHQSGRSVVATLRAPWPILAHDFDCLVRAALRTRALERVSILHRCRDRHRVRLVV